MCYGFRLSVRHLRAKPLTQIQPFWFVAVEARSRAPKKIIGCNASSPLFVWLPVVVAWIACDRLSGGSDQERVGTRAQGFKVHIPEADDRLVSSGGNRRAVG